MTMGVIHVADVSTTVVDGSVCRHRLMCGVAWRGAAQTPPVDCKSIASKNGTSCNQTTTITKPVTATDGTTVPQTTTVQQSSTTTTSYGTTSWQGLNWGIGIAADFDLGGKRVTGATIDTVPGGSIVRVTDTSGNVGVSFVLEAHYFVKEWLLPVH
jgi:hypothetical protein